MSKHATELENPFTVSLFCKEKKNLLLVLVEFLKVQFKPT